MASELRLQISKKLKKSSKTNHTHSKKCFHRNIIYFPLCAIFIAFCVHTRGKKLEELKSSLRHGMAHTGSYKKRWDGCEMMMTIIIVYPVSGNNNGLSFYFVDAILYFVSKSESRRESWKKHTSKLAIVNDGKLVVRWWRGWRRGVMWCDVSPFELVFFYCDAGMQ